MTLVFVILSVLVLHINAGFSKGFRVSKQTVIVRGTVFIFFFFISINRSFAQQSEIDSIHNLIKRGSDDTLKVKRLNIISWKQKNVGQNKEALHSATLALALATQLDFKRGMADAYNMIGVASMQLGEPRKALDNYMLSIELRKETDDKNGLAASFNNLGLVYYSTGNFSKALENYEFAVNINKITGNNRWLANNYNNIGNIYADKNNATLALENYFLAKELKDELKEISDPQYANIVNNIGNVYFLNGEYEKASESFQRALDIRIDAGDLSGIATSYIAIGSVFFDQMKIEADSARKKQLFDKTLENFTASEKIYADIEDQYGLAISRLNIGSLHLKNRNTKEARKMLLSALTLFKESNLNDFTKDACEMLAQCDSTDGNWKSAYEYHKLYKQYSDSIFTNENSRKIAEMSTRFETEKKEDRIKLLEKDKKSARLFFVIFVLLVAGLLFFGKRAYDNKKKVAEFMKIESENKEVMLQEVHHRINNNLQIISSLLFLQAKTAGNDRLNEYLKESQNRIQSLSALHELLYQTDSPLKVNMAEYFQKILGFHSEIMSTLSRRINLITEIEDVQFETKVAVPLALILNELVTNSIKHAFPDGKSGFIKVSLQKKTGDSELWIMTIADSGKGLLEDDQYRKNSFGLRLVEIMTKQIQGTLVKRNNHGATFEIIFNLSEYTKI